MSHQSIDDDGEATPDPTDLDAKQLRTLRAISEHPDATQSELADVLDVSAPTVSNRVNSIPGFSWAVRREYVTSLFDGSTADESAVDEPATDEPAMEKSTTDEQATDGAGVRDERLESLAADVAALEAEVASLADRLQDQSSDDALTDPELVHKVVHACVHSDRISEDEEVQIMESILS